MLVVVKAHSIFLHFWPLKDEDYRLILCAQILGRIEVIDDLMWKHMPKLIHPNYGQKILWFEYSK